MSSGFSYCLDFLETINNGAQRGEGISRLAYSEADSAARATVVKAMNDLGLSVFTDEVGNIWGTRAGRDLRAPSVVIGSHIDTVPDGGRYDGTLGVASALGVVRDVLEQCPDHDHPLTVAVLSGEESSRFGVSNVGSKAINGFMTLSSFFDYEDSLGINIFKAMRDFGLYPEYYDRARIVPGSMKAFLELHIEQGPVLDRSDIDVGVVEAVAAPSRISLTLLGESSHSGACPMNLRRDSLAAASEIILAVEKTGREQSDKGTVATVGVCNVHPNAMNVVPGTTQLMIDVRGINYDSIQLALNNIENSIKKICSDRLIRYELRYLSKGTPISLDGRLRALIGSVCDKLSLRWKNMPSGAGHDAMYMMSSVPTAMIFVPCIDGISHSSLESVEIGRIRPGYMALLETVKQLIIKQDRR